MTSFSMSSRQLDSLRDEADVELARQDKEMEDALQRLVAEMGIDAGTLSMIEHHGVDDSDEDYEELLHNRPVSAAVHLPLASAHNSRHEVTSDESIVSDESTKTRLRAAVSHAEDIRRNAAAAHERHMEEIAHLESECAALKRECGKHAMEGTRAAQAEASVNELSRRCKILEDEKDAAVERALVVQRIADDHKEAADSLRSELLNTTAEMAKVQKRCNDLESACAESNARENTHKEENARLESECASLRLLCAKHATDAARAAHAEANVGDLARRCASLEGDRVAAVARADALQRDLLLATTEASAKIETAVATKCAELSEKLAAAEREAAKVESARKKDAGDQCELIARLEAECMRLRGELSSLHATKAALLESGQPRTLDSPAGDNNRTPTRGRPDCPGATVDSQFILAATPPPVEKSATPMALRSALGALEDQLRQARAALDAACVRERARAMEIESLEDVISKIERDARHIKTVASESLRAEYERRIDEVREVCAKERRRAVQAEREKFDRMLDEMRASVIDTRNKSLSRMRSVVAEERRKGRVLESEKEILAQRIAELAASGAVDGVTPRSLSAERAHIHRTERKNADDEIGDNDGNDGSDAAHWKSSPQAVASSRPLPGGSTAVTSAESEYDRCAAGIRAEIVRVRSRAGGHAHDAGVDSPLARGHEARDTQYEAMPLSHRGMLERTPASDHRRRFEGGTEAPHTRKDDLYLARTPAGSDRRHVGAPLHADDGYATASPYTPLTHRTAHGPRKSAAEVRLGDDTDPRGRAAANALDVLGDDGTVDVFDRYVSEWRTSAF